MNDAAVKILTDYAQRTVHPLMLNPPSDPASVGSIPAMIVPDGKGTIITLEHLGPGRARFRGTYQTSFMSEFIGYVKSHASQSESEGFIEPNSCAACVILNIGDASEPGHADWRALLKMERTAAYKALQDHEGKLLTQQQTLEFIEDFQKEIEGRKADGIAGETGMLPAAVITAFRNLSWTAKAEQSATVKDMGASRTALEEVEVRGSGGLPTHLAFEAVPYVGFDSREFLLRVSIVWREEKPLIMLRMVGKESVLEAIAAEFKSSLLNGIGDACQMSIGSFSP